MPSKYFRKKIKSRSSSDLPEAFVMHAHRIPHNESFNLHVIGFATNKTTHYTVPYVLISGRWNLKRSQRNTYEFKHLSPFIIFVSHVINFQNGEICHDIRFNCLYAFSYCDGLKYVQTEMSLGRIVRTWTKFCLWTWQVLYLFDYLIL